MFNIIFQLLEIFDKTSQRKQLPECFDIDGFTVTDKRVTANKFNDFFTSINYQIQLSKHPSRHAFQFKPDDEESV